MRTRIWQTDRHRSAKYDALAAILWRGGTWRVGPWDNSGGMPVPFLLWQSKRNSFMFRLGAMQIKRLAKMHTRRKNNQLPFIGFSEPWERIFRRIAGRR